MSRAVLAEYLSTIIALRSLGRLDDAERVIADVAALFPDSGAMAFERARLAEARQDWPLACRLWEEARARFPDEPASSLMLATILVNKLARPAEAEPILAEAVARFPDHAGIASQYAACAFARGDGTEALRRYWATREKFPLLAEAHLKAAALLREHGRRDSAETLLAQAVQRLPDDAEIAAEYARARGDRAAALDRYAALRARFPQLPAGYQGAATILTELNRPEEAEALLSEGIERLPDNAELAIKRGWIAAFSRKDLPAALISFEQVRQRFPHFVIGHQMTLVLLRDLRRFDEAEQVGIEAMARFPDDKKLAIDYAWTVNNRRDWPRAIQQWEVIKARFPDDPVGYASLGVIFLKEMPDPERAEIVLAEAVDRFPNHKELAISHARAASRRGDLDEAEIRWRALESRFPGEEAVRTGLGHVLLQRQFRAVDAGTIAGSGGDSTPSPPGSGANVASTSSESLPETNVSSAGAVEDLRKFFLNFEGLGRNCEFGLVQRHFGAEPLGLLRWNAIEPDKLKSALDARFEGVGSPEFTKLTVIRGEYCVHDRRYGMVMHTFLEEKDGRIDSQRLQLQMYRRLQFLKDKMIETLTEHRKIFVYQSSATIPLDQMVRIHESLGRYGDNSLLYVRESDAAHRLGLVEVAGNGFLVGYIDHLIRVDEPWSNISFDPWLKICQSAFDQLRAA